MKKEQKTEISRKRILEAAIQEFGEKGYMGASISNICNAGIPKGLVYHNFKNRDEIYVACVKESYHRLLDSLESADLKASLEEYLSARLLFFTEQAAEASIIMETMVNCPPALHQVIEEEKREFDRYNYQFLQTVLSNMSLRKNISQEDALQYFSFMQLLLHSYMKESDVMKEKKYSVAVKHEEVLGRIIDLLLYGIAEKGCNYDNDVNA